MNVDINDIKMTISKIRSFENFVKNLENEYSLLMLLSNIVESNDSNLSEKTENVAEYLKQISIKIDLLYGDIIDKIKNYSEKSNENNIETITSLKKVNQEIDDINNVLSDI